jgi:hypothetical protein
VTKRTGVSVRRERGGFQNRGPARNFRLNQASETHGRSLLLGRDRSAQLGQSLPHLAMVSLGVPLGAKMPAQMLI